MVLPVMLSDYNPPFPKNESLVDLIEYDASWGGEIEVKDVEFHDYPSGTDSCGARTRLFESHRDASDFTPEVLLDNTVLMNVNYQALAYLNTPNPNWKVVDKCGEIDCSGLSNVIVSFYRDLTALPSDALGLP